MIDVYVKDMFNVGGGLCEEFVVCFIIECVKVVLSWLIGYGVFFDIEKMEFGEECFYLICEGGYSYCWILYVVDVMGEVF